MLIQTNLGEDNCAQTVRLRLFDLGSYVNNGRYCVRPNSGVIRPGSDVEVQGESNVYLSKVMG